MSPLQTFFGLAATAVLIDLAIRLVALVVVPRNRLPTAAMAWLLAIFFIPVVGVLLYLAIGSPELPKERRRKQREMDAVVAEESARAPATDLDDAPEWLDSVVNLTRNLTSMPL